LRTIRTRKVSEVAVNAVEDLSVLVKLDIIDKQ
jgi:hypothetical protein